MELRSKERLDYAVLNETGERVPLAGSSNMAVAPESEAKLSGELSGLVFQINEVVDDLKDVNQMGSTALRRNLEELKELRVKIVKVSSEMNFLKGNKDAVQDPNITAVLASSKSMIRTVENAIDTRELNAAQVNASQDRAERGARKYAFDMAITEMVAIIGNLTTKYNVRRDLNITSDIVLKRKEMKSSYATEFDRLKHLVDRVLDCSDVVFIGKETLLNTNLQKVVELETLKMEFEEKLQKDLEDFDLTDQKMKLATLTKVDIGKFSGSLDKGFDFYTFKSKFLKAYCSHPKKLLVEWLVNNHLEGKAKECVGALEDLDAIWERLKSTFGSTEQMLMHHFKKIHSMGLQKNVKTLESKMHYMQKLVNIMQDIYDLAIEHGLTPELHYGAHVPKIVMLLEIYIQNKWYKLATENKLTKPQRWQRLLDMLQSELEILKMRVSEELDDYTNQDRTNSDKTTPKGGAGGTTPKGGGSKALFGGSPENCKLCDEKHTKCNVAFIYCKKFLELPRKDRIEFVRNKQYCYQCLSGKTKWRDPKHECEDVWACKNSFHEGYNKKMHFLLCDDHADDQENKDLYEKFKTEKLTAEWQKKLHATAYHTSHLSQCDQDCSSDDGELNDENTSTCYILQPFPFAGTTYNLMFDTGCQTFVSRSSAIDSLPDENKINTQPGPMVITGVGCQQVESDYGLYTVKLPSYDGTLVNLTGICLETITGIMPPYPVQEAREDIVAGYKAQGGKEYDLPQVPVSVGGDTDFLIGMRYNYYQPRLVFILPTGLALYESLFVGVDGTRGCIGGSHELFLQCEQQFLETNNVAQFKTFLAQQIQLFNNGMKVCLDCTSFSLGHANTNGAPNDDEESGDEFEEEPAVVYNDDKVLLVGAPADSPPKDLNEVIERNIVVVDVDNVDSKPLAMLSSKVKLYNEAEKAASSIEYRCIKCRGCSNCKQGGYAEMISLKEEREQDLIESSITVDFENKISTALLPFVVDPDEKLAPNKDIALKVYNQQVKKLSKDPVLKDNVLKAEKKLHDAGHVDWVDNLTSEQIELLNAGVNYYLPWRYVQNENSLSTPVRPVFDGSSVTESGESLNTILAKGINSLTNLLELNINFRSHAVAVNTDIKQMYPSVKLRPEHWRFQKYLWDEQLTLGKDPSDKVIKTIIFGVKSSGNQAECALRLTAKAQQDTFPEAAHSVIKETYVDDIVSGAESTPKAEQLSSDIIQLVAGGGFETKGIVMSGKDPPTALSKDGVSVNIIGIKWYPLLDEIKLAFGKLNFSKRVRGKKKIDENSFVIPKKLTRKICLGKMAEIYDLIGLVAPINAGFKIDMHKLVKSTYGWDDQLTDEDRKIWVDNFQLMESLGDAVWSRVIVPEDAVNLDMELLGCGDASKDIACATCYVRFLRKDGTYSCSLALAKTKLVPDGMTLPRGELLSSVLNTHVTEIVRRALERFTVVKSVYVLDSEIALHWIASESKRLQPWTRNAVIEISRFTLVMQWFHIESELNLADIGTRKGAKLPDVDRNSEYHNGKEWSHESFDKLIGSVLKDVNQVKLKNEQLAEVKKELVKPHTDLCTLVEDKNDETATASVYHNTDATTIGERLKFSQYLIDPNKFKFAKVVRIQSLVIKACNRFLSKKGRKLKMYSPEEPPIERVISQWCKDLNEISELNLTDADIQMSLDYFFRKGTEELKHFVNPKVYEKESVEKDGILYYTGRVSASDISFHCDVTEKMLDLSDKSFVVPIVDRQSPLAFAIVNQVHWYDETYNHTGVESTVRGLMPIAHILKGRDLVKIFRKNCKRCRYLLKRTIEVIMSPTSKDQLCVAPPFYVTQTDICGPFKAYSIHNKRATVKVYILVFVCCTTGTTSLKIMDGYDTIQFLHSFSRFSCELGFPKKLIVDEGSQLVCGCENVVLNMTDIKGTLNREHGVEFRTCPVGGHNFNGKAERKVRTVREVLEKTVHLSRLSILEWETLCAEMANSINNLPIAVGNITEDLENLDLITPNRLRLGRNNQRSPIGTLQVTDKLERLMRLKTDVFNSWWEAWLVSAVPKLMAKPKWFSGDKDVKKGDVVIFCKVEGDYAGEYRYGMIEGVHISADGKTRSVDIKYRNAHENVMRTTRRAVRSLVIIHRVDEIDIMDELGSAVAYANGCFCMEFSASSAGV